MSDDTNSDPEHFSDGIDRTVDRCHAQKDEYVPGTGLSAMMVFEHVIFMTVSMSETSWCFWFGWMRAWTVFPGQL